VRDRNSSIRLGLAGLAAILAPLVLAGYASPAAAIESYTPADHPFWTIDEVRVGVLDHALEDTVSERGVALNLEVLGGRFGGGYENGILNFLLTPRPHLGTTLGFGKTDEFYWGVTWDAKLSGPAFLEASFGGAAHDGAVSTPGEPSYGCEVNFRESASVGFSLTAQWRLLATVDHMSNANLCHPNHGLTNAGIRLGYHF
jgi:hypothetical protein